MITPSYSVTATERVLPRLALDFTTAVADPRVVTTRAANTATRFNSSGVIEIVNANLPRYDFNPSSLVCLGQLIEEARTNLFLNSLIDGTNLATQSVTLTAVSHTLSFYGSGSVDITGGHTATVAGIGNFPNRRTYTFTPTAGSSTFTITGDVKFAQIETGSFATSFIPTAATSVLRNADVVTMTGANFTDWYNASEGAFVVECTPLTVTSGFLISSEGATSANTIDIRANGQAVVVSTSSVQFTSTVFAPTVGQTTKLALAVKQNNFGFCVAAGTVSTGTSGVVPFLSRMFIGSRSLGNFWSGRMRSVRYFPQRLTNAEMQAFSKG
jgi:hypothetical protein